MRTLSTARESWPLAHPFRISRGERLTSDVVVAIVGEDGHVGRGECFPYAHYGETVETVEAQIRALEPAVVAGLAREEMLETLPAGAARNAIDCALWDLLAKQAGCRAWELAGLAEPGPLTTAYTLGVDTPAAMARKAAANRARPQFKLKMTGDGLDLERVAAIHAAAPGAALIVDANEGWSIAQYAELAPRLGRLGVTMIEQPLPAASDDALAGALRPVPVCADESCHDRGSLPALAGKYDMVNIKLDKTGGLTEALRLRDAAQAAGYGIMVGCMIGTSLAMAPATLVAQGALVVDLDGPLLLARDRDPGLSYAGSVLAPPPGPLWG